MSEIQYLQPQQRYAMATIHGDTVYLAGQVAADPSGSVEDQTRQILAQIDALLSQAGTDKGRMLSVMIYLADIRNLSVVNGLWDRWIVPGCFPARTPVEARLAAPEYLIEIQVTAAR